MLLTYLKSPVTRRRLCASPAADHLDAFADWLRLQGYTPITAEGLLRSLAGWTDWMIAAGFTAQDFLQAFDACGLAVRKERRVHYSRGPNRRSMAAAAVFIRFLQQTGKLPLPVPAPSASGRWPVLAEFRSWMRDHRGLAETTLDLYEGILPDLLDSIGTDARGYSPEALRAFVQERARPNGVHRARCIVVAVRAFVRFLGATKQCSPGMEYAIPGFANWQLSSVPKFLAAEDIERVIQSCGNDAFGLRDKPVLLLLARLGLRAREVAELKFVDIDWRNGSVAVCGKGRRHETLPLPQEVGDAILLYLNHGRPSLKVPEVFTTVRAPFRALTRASVTHVVRSALRRTGIKAPINGAHVLRHSAATTMLRQGATLAGVGAILRHRSPMTTAHYAKVDFGLLSEIAQPWPEVPSC